VNAPHSDGSVVENHGLLPRFRHASIHEVRLIAHGYFQSKFGVDGDPASAKLNLR
jgi:hypothetical protein